MTTNGVYCAVTLEDGEVVMTDVVNEFRELCQLEKPLKMDGLSPETRASLKTHFIRANAIYGSTGQTPYDGRSG